MTQLEIDQLRAEKFSQAEVCWITNLSPERLLTWHKLELIPELRTEIGKGHRRKYTFHQLAYLKSMSLLVKRGISLAEAKILSEVSLVGRIREAFDEVCAQSCEEADALCPILIAIHYLDEEEEHSVKVFFAGRPIGDQGEDQGIESIQHWMRAKSINDIIVISPAEIAIALRRAMNVVMSNRGRDGWREELREYLKEFKRPKPQPKDDPAHLISEAYRRGLRPEEQDLIGEGSTRRRSKAK